MKTLIKIALLSTLLAMINPVHAQPVNWARLDEGNKHVISANLGFEYGFVYGLAYRHQFRTGLFPFLASIEYSAPAGNDIFDDYKFETGVLIRWIKLNDFQFSTKANGVFRRYENDFARLVNFGSDMTGIMGYYRSRWFTSFEFGFDKAIVTHFKHSREYQILNPIVANGWFEPSTGGNFYFGLQTGLSIRASDISLRMGKVLTQDFRTTPYIPYYFQFGYNVRF